MRSILIVLTTLLAGAAFAQSIHRVLEQQHLHFALPSAPARGVGSAGKVCDERLAERRVRRRSLELLRLRDRYPPASGATLEELDSVARELRAQAGQQHGSFGSIEIADHASSWA